MIIYDYILLVNDLISIITQDHIYMVQANLIKLCIYIYKYKILIFYEFLDK